MIVNAGWLQAETRGASSVEEALLILRRKNLLVLLHGDASVARLLFSFSLLNGHGLVYPFIGGFWASSPGRRNIAPHICPVLVPHVILSPPVVGIRPLPHPPFPPF